ncbi:hypothetical protein FAVG1_08544 [Fusarium avenaceum]|nr:hypothetical protein FAVG1_08544 [Fusarium avenaceum]
MDEKRRQRIAAALRQYREMILQHNLLLLRLLVEVVEAQPLPPGYRESAAQLLRMKGIRKRIGIPESVKSLGDLHNENVISVLVLSASLEGVDNNPVDLEQRKEYFAGVQASIAEKGVEVSEFPPIDLEYLCTLVSGITGPGLPFHRRVNQFDFVTPLASQDIKEMAQTVCVPIRNVNGESEYNELTYIWEEWHIAIAFKIGGGPRPGGSYAIYCRKEDNEQWKWRYGVQDEDWYSDVYENVEEFLGFYTHFNEQTEEELKGIVLSLTALRQM